MNKIVNGVAVEMTAADIDFINQMELQSMQSKPAQYSAQIDADTDAIYRDAVGNRVPEYEAAERDAIVFIQSEYNPPPPEFVRSYADASGLSYTQAANNIIAQAEAWRQAMQVIRSNRLAAKNGVRGDNPDAAMAQWQAFVAGIRQQLGI